MTLKVCETAFARTLRIFRNDEAGAVTVDWVVLTAAIVGISLLVMIPTFTTADSAASAVSNSLVDTVLAAAGLGG